MKKITALLLCCLSLFLLAGCEGSTTSTEPETVENLEITLQMKDWDSTGLALEDIERTGTYTGEVIDGIPNGTGRFDAQNDEGDPWYYEGEFVNGTFQGQGSSIWDSDQEIINEKGTYEDGAFTPTLSEFVAMAPQFLLNEFALSETSAAFIDIHENLFPCETEEDTNEAISLTDDSIGYVQLAKNATPYLEILFTQNRLSAVQVFENNAYGYTYTTIFANDEDFNYFIIYYIGSIEIYEGDTFDVRALPLAYSNFDNVSNGQTVVVAALGSILEKTA